MRTGLDVFLDVPFDLGGIGLLTNAASLCKDGRTTYQALRDIGVDIRAVFAPGDGYYGIDAVREVIPNGQHEFVTVQRLYTALSNIDQLRGLSGLVIDLQEIGTRLHGFFPELHHTLTACAELKLPVLVLDRPNPLGGLAVEGPVGEATFRRTLPYGDVPLRHGLTIGEVALWMNEMIAAPLEVMRMEGWMRSMLFADTGLTWTAPTPDVPHLSTAMLYSGTRLFETLTLSVGHGTTLPYEQFGAPFMDADQLVNTLAKLYLPGVAFTPAWFRPTMGMFERVPCEGTRIHILDPQQVNIHETTLAIMLAILQLYPDDIKWLTHEADYLFDMCLGTSQVREGLFAGRDLSMILSDIRLEASAFQSESAELFLYE